MCIILWSPLSRSLRSLRFGPGNAGGMPWIFLLGCVLRAPLRVKDFPLTLPLDGFFDGFFLQRIRWGEMSAWEIQDVEYYRYYSPPGEPNRANMKTSAESRVPTSVGPGDHQRGSGSTNKLSLLRILTCAFTWIGGAPACSFRTLASSLMAAR
jgi:hypothetical protein